MAGAFERAHVAALDAQRKTEARIDTQKSSNVFIPPRKRAVSSLCDWISDNPDFKQSKAYNKLLDAYWEAIGHSCQ